MRWGRLRQLFEDLKGRLRWERGTAGDSRHLQELSESIVEYGRMIQSHLGYGGYGIGDGTAAVVVEVPEMAHRFRETPKTIKRALVLLQVMGLAEPIHLRGCWRLQVARIRLGDAKGFPLATYIPDLDPKDAEKNDDESDRGAA
jgi:hypothetical protein